MNMLADEAAVGSGEAAEVYFQLSDELQGMEGGLLKLAVLYAYEGRLTMLCES